MKKTKSILYVLIFCSLIAIMQSFAQPIPVILDTDIGTDMDDVWALALILCSPELDLKLIVTDSHDTVEKAKIVAKFLQLFHREDIPIGIGKKMDKMTDMFSAWAKDFQIKKYSGVIHEDGVQKMIDTIMQSPQKITILVTAPCPSIEEALKREPQITQKAKVIAMGGSISIGYDEMPTPDAEYNIRTCISAAQAMFKANWDLSITPLDITDSISIRGSEFQDLLRFADQKPNEITINPMMDAYRQWTLITHSRVDPEIRTTTLYDTAPVVLAIQPSFFEMEDISLKVDNRGYTVIDPKAKKVHVASHWKKRPDNEDPVSTFSEFLVKRYLKGIIKKPNSLETHN